MSNVNVELLVHRHLMGEAYKEITARFGPSAQSIALYNYANMSDDSLGLESLHVMDRHQQLLAEIDADQSLEIATEGLRDSIIKYRKWLIFGGLFVLPLLPIGIAGVVMRSNDKKAEVAPVKLFIALSKLYQQASKVDAQITAALPTTFDEKSWAKFVANDFNAQMDKIKEELDKVHEDPANAPVALSASGWTAQSYVNGNKWLKDNGDKFNESEKKRAARLSSIEQKVESSDKATAAALPHISKAMATISRSSKLVLSVLTELKSLQVKVSHNFNHNEDSSEEAEKKPAEK